MKWANTTDVSLACQLKATPCDISVHASELPPPIGELKLGNAPGTRAKATAVRAIAERITGNSGSCPKSSGTQQTFATTGLSPADCAHCLPTRYARTKTSPSQTILSGEVMAPPSRVR